MVAVFFSFIFTGCAMEEPNAPCIVSDIRVETGQKEEYFRFAGLLYTVYNSSNKTIVHSEVYARIFTSRGENPFPGSNSITARCPVIIEPQQSVDMVIPLDTLFSIVPEDSLVADGFTVTKVVFADGTVWTDPLSLTAGR